MKTAVLTLFAGLLVAAPALAGDLEEGEKLFKKCRSCHRIVADDGTEVRKGGKWGPNLWGIIGRPAASDEDYDYGSSLTAAGEAGLVWDEAQLQSYVQDPTGFLQTFLDDSNASTRMPARLKTGLEDITFYLASVGAVGRAP